MTLESQLAPFPDRRLDARPFFARARGALQQIWLALGAKGVAWAAAAGLVAVLCGAVSLTDAALSLGASEVDYSRNKAAEIQAFDQKNRAMMRSIFSLSGGRGRLPAGDLPVSQAWERVQAARVAICGQLDDRASRIAELRAVCAETGALYERLGPQIAAFDPPRQPIDPVLLQEAVSVFARVNDLSLALAGEADALVGRMADEYREALRVLFLSTGGFAAACLVLIGLVGRTAIRHYEQSQRAGEARDLLQETIEAVPAGIAVYDRDERLMLFNATAAEVTPTLQRADVIGMTYEALTRETVRESAEKGQVLEGTPEEWVERFRRRGSSRNRQWIGGRWFEWSEKLTPSGRTVGLRVDITEIKQRELEAERSRAEYQSLVDSMSDMVFKADIRTGVVTFVSDSSVALFGLTPEQVIGTNTYDHVVADDREDARAAVQAALRSDRDGVHQLQFRVRMVGGAERHVEVRLRRLPAAEGCATVAGVMRDIEDRVQLTRRLDAEMARLRSIVESSGALIVLVDRDLAVVMTNSGFTAATGIAGSDAVGRPMKEVVDFPLDPRRLEGWLAGRFDPARIEPVRFASRIRDRQGRRRLVSVTATPVLDAAGRVISIVFLGVDDTERREAERALFDAERLATVGEMAATVAHEITQPLQVINIACASAEQELADAADSEVVPDGAFLRSKLDRIARQVERAGRIVGELRAFVRGTEADETAPFDPAAAVHMAIDLTQYTVRQAGVALSVSVADGLPAVTGHVGRLEQVLVNLIVNARDAGGRTVEVAARTVDRGGRPCVCITVEDAGPGIPADILPQLFKGFVTTKPRGKGTGLGLRICRRIVEEMGGTIAAANRAEGGARFEIVLPAAGEV